MTDLISRSAQRAALEPPDAAATPAARVREPASTDAAVGEDRLRTLTETIELMFFAYRDFTGEADQYLSTKGFGRAHHRVIYFVTRHPGLSVADLLAILKITKQSLARVLKQLIDEGYIDQEPGPQDRRQRLLFATPKGAELARSLTELQMRRVAEALDATGPDAASVVHAFLVGMISQEDRPSVKELLRSSASPVAGGDQT